MVTPIKAILSKCLDCSCGSANEVKLCPITRCQLFPYRFGKNPTLQKERTPSQLEALRKGRVPFGSVDNPTHFQENPATEGNYTTATQNAESTLSAE